MAIPKPTETLPEEVLAALGITQTDVFIVRHDADGALIVITKTARKLRYLPGTPDNYPPIHTIVAPKSKTETKPEPGTSILTTLQQRSDARARRIARKAKAQPDLSKKE